MGQELYDRFWQRNGDSREGKLYFDHAWAFCVLGQKERFIVAKGIVCRAPLAFCCVSCLVVRPFVRSFAVQAINVDVPTGMLVESLSVQNTGYKLSQDGTKYKCEFFGVPDVLAPLTGVVDPLLGGTIESPPNAVTPGTYQHVVCTWDGETIGASGTLRLYIDGVEVATPQPAAENLVGSLLQPGDLTIGIGGLLDTSLLPVLSVLDRGVFVGSLDEVALYDTV